MGTRGKPVAHSPQPTANYSIRPHPAFLDTLPHFAISLFR
jgi:hypothetical protein